MGTNLTKPFPLSQLKERCFPALLLSQARPPHTGAGHLAGNPPHRAPRGEGNCKFNSSRGPPPRTHTRPGWAPSRSRLRLGGAGGAGRERDDETGGPSPPPPQATAACPSRPGAAWGYIGMAEGGRGGGTGLKLPACICCCTGSGWQRDAAAALPGEGGPAAGSLPPLPAGVTCVPRAADPQP